MTILTPITRIMLIEEEASGRQGIWPHNRPDWLEPGDWQGWPVLAIDPAAKELHIVAIWAARRRAFTDLLNAAVDHGLSPVVVAPFGQMQDILERWGWHKTVIGEGATTREEWRPPEG